MDELTIAVSAVFFASCLQGMIGFGAGLVSMSLITLIWPIAFATAVMNPLGFALNMSLAWQNRRNVFLKRVSPLLIGVPIGIYVGLQALHHLDEAHLQLILGTALLIAVAHTQWGGSSTRSIGSFVVGCVGVLSGLCGVSVSSAGPPVLVYASFAGWDQSQYRANLSVFFGVTSLLSCVGLTWSGLITTDSLSMTVVLIPVALLGSVAGYRLSALISKVLFTRLTLALLLIMALRLILTALG